MAEVAFLDDAVRGWYVNTHPDREQEYVRRNPSLRNVHVQGTVENVSLANVAKD